MAKVGFVWYFRLGFASTTLRTIAASPLEMYHEGALTARNVATEAVGGKDFRARNNLERSVTDLQSSQKNAQSSLVAGS